MCEQKINSASACPWGSTSTLECGYLCVGSLVFTLIPRLFNSDVRGLVRLTFSVLLLKIIGPEVMIGGEGFR